MRGSLQTQAQWQRRTRRPKRSRNVRHTRTWRRACRRRCGGGPCGCRPRWPCDQSASTSSGSAATVSCEEGAAPAVQVAGAAKASALIRAPKAPDPAPSKPSRKDRLSTAQILQAYRGARSEFPAATSETYSTFSTVVVQTNQAVTLAFASCVKSIGSESRVGPTFGIARTDFGILGGCISDLAA